MRFAPHRKSWMHDCIVLSTHTHSLSHPALASVSGLPASTGDTLSVQTYLSSSASSMSDASASPSPTRMMLR